MSRCYNCCTCCFRYAPHLRIPQVQLKGPNGLWSEVGRTEVVNNDLNPKFEKKVEMDYTFEKKQELKFLVYDW